MAKKESDVHFSKDKMFIYNINKKRKFMFYTILFSILIIIGIIYYILYLRNSNFFLVRWINFFVLHIAQQMKDLTVLGSFYTTLFGGLFFVPTPIEVLYIAFLTKGGINPVVLISLFITGMIISFSINYLIGMKLSNLSKKIIGAKKFYKIKVTLNKHGMWAVFGFNVLPLPSQPFAALLGVFRYNRTKFYLMFISGQLIKFIAIALAYVYIF